MEKIITISIPPKLEIYAVLRPSLEAVFKRSGFDGSQAALFVGAVEEVFTYCAKLITAAKSGSWIQISVGQDQVSLQVTIAHEGPCGSLEKYFTKDAKKELRRTSFDAMGLYIAKKIVNDLIYTGFGGGKNEFALVVNLPESP